MRRVRIAYEGSYHHVMNRGIQGEDIFLDDRAKTYFLDVMAEKSHKLKMKILAYCVMSNHYHLILQNTSGKLSEFMRQVNGQYGIYYRKRKGGKGYVFQDRFKSILVQDDRYLKMAILYVLLNPVRRGYMKCPWEYRWSSIEEYYTGSRSSTVDNKFVEEIFETHDSLNLQLNDWGAKELPVRQTVFGDILGEDVFADESIKKFDRRKNQRGTQRKRKEESSFTTSEQVISDFEDRHGFRLTDINLATHKGRALRAELLVALKDKAGLTYTEIMKYPLFTALKYSSLGQLYKRARNKLKKKHGG